ncbi:MAG: hypothetical protein A2663_03515 [Candidatus Buchananbacteria bacterium RIFCSPHIGHO2_01_FULL_46_12]|uniref:SprT-like domain-containing protein n=2 Tax=Candidatus Buchananiibacteriota TaxID=1817903 RepID=A0A1G1YQ10_9BACT|nr:MAG: hypothetical protein A2663_03515 [Candidatus Buchananbacteria bacterium RIFCSPHIGHO2_01_FULL_46_12]OGY54443.1 MAG: hypothetical protein A3B15_00760 [Candidatus Buchananbacteria bacterium RIFCSPLOWO2_01_FULL_45_31]
MKKEGISLGELKKKLKKWQKNLLLNNWVISLKIVDFKRPDFCQSGDIKVDLKRKKATVLLTSRPFRDEEKVILHELVHLLLWDFDHFCERLALKHSRPMQGDHDKYFGKLEKQVSQLTEIYYFNYKKRTGSKT